MDYSLKIKILNYVIVIQSDTISVLQICTRAYRLAGVVRLVQLKFRQKRRSNRNVSRGRSLAASKSLYFLPSHCTAATYSALVNSYREQTAMQHTMSGRGLTST